MNEAGTLQAQFSNSLLLFTERGGFAFPGAPSGIAIARALQAEGPLVTSISVDVGSAVKTTVKMDLYTSSFGKLQKQKEGAIASIARERQKIIDQNNNAIRRGLGKAAGNNNLLGGLLANGGQRIIDAAKQGEIYFSNIEEQKVKRPDMMTFSAVTENYQTNSEELTDLVSNGIQAIMQPKETFEEVISLFSDLNTQRKKYQETAGGYFTDLFKPFSKQVDDPNFSSPKYNNQNAKNKRTNYNQ